MAWVLLAVAAVLVALPAVIYPAVLRLAAPFYPAADAPNAKPGRASVVVAFTGSGPLLRSKVTSLADAAADSPWRIDLILAGDGPIAEADKQAALTAAGNLPVTVCALDAPSGKAHALNLGVGYATGDLLVFSDLDAAVDGDALSALLRWFADPSVGAVCGRRQIVQDRGAAFAAAGQSTYTALDSQIKLLENRLGAITSNDGKLYAMRRSIYQPIHPAATDDLYNALTVVAQGYRIVFEPDAVARIPAPAWTIGHDLARRRRVTLRSLTGLCARPALLLTGRFGLFGPRLVINKLLRRLLPVAALLAVAALLLLAPGRAWAGWMLAAALGAGLAAGAYPLVTPRDRPTALPPKIDKLWSAAFYFGLGMLGMLLGVIDFLRGKRIARWAPRKTA